MKRTNKNIISIILISIFFVLIYGCINDSKIKVTDTMSIEFEQIGYFKDDQQRVFTFYINSTEKIDKNNVPEKLWSVIEGHGKQQMNTQGKNTQSFYYLSRTNTPDVTNMKTYVRAIDKAYLNESLSLVYIMFNGEKGIIRNPTE